MLRVSQPTLGRGFLVTQSCISFGSSSSCQFGQPGAERDESLMKRAWEIDGSLGLGVCRVKQDATVLSRQLRLIFLSVKHSDTVTG